MMNKDEFRRAADLGRFSIEGTRLKKIQLLIVNYHKASASSKEPRLNMLLDVLKEYIESHMGGKDTTWERYSAAVALWAQASEELQRVYGKNPTFGLLEGERFIKWITYQRHLKCVTIGRKPSSIVRTDPIKTALNEVVKSETFQQVLNMHVGQGGTPWWEWLINGLTPSLLSAWTWGDKQKFLDQLAGRLMGRTFAYNFYMEMLHYCDKRLNLAEISMVMDQAFSIAGMIIAPLKAPLSSFASNAVSAGMIASKSGLKEVASMAKGKQMMASQEGVKKYDAYKVDLALLDYLADVNLASRDTKNEKVLIEELGRGKNIWAQQCDIRYISTSLLCGVDV